jgi:hypothetical protein
MEKRRRIKRGERLKVKGERGKIIIFKHVLRYEA